MAEGLTLNAAFLCALAAAAAGAAAYAFGRPSFSKAAPPAMGLSWLALTAGLALLWARLGRAPLSNQYESLLTMLWLVFALAFFYYRRTGRSETLTSAAVIASLLFGAAALLDKTARPLMPALRSDWLTLHVLSSMAAYAAFGLAAAAAARALLKREAHLFEDLLARLAKTGFALLTLGIATGAVWAEAAWGNWWSWDPKETWSLLTWLAYAAVLHLRRRGLKEHHFAALLVTCFALVLFTYFGVNYLLAGLHSYAR